MKDRRHHKTNTKSAVAIVIMKISNIHELYSRAYPGRFGININPHYDVLFSIMKSNHEELSSNDTNEGSSQQILGHDLEEESLYTDDFSTSTSTELKTTSSSQSDDLKTSSGSAGNESEINHNEESENSSDDRKPSSTEDTKTVSCSATETETTLNESEIASDNDRKPSPRTNDDGEEEAQTSPHSEHLIRAELNQANQNHESFPFTLRRMLNIETSAGHQSIKWLADGGGFEVTDQNALEKDILPKYFPSSCLFQSFVRKLYRWGFLQVGKKKSGHYVFSNESFNRDSDSYKQLKAIPRPRPMSKHSSTKAPKNELQTGKAASNIPDEQLVAVQSDVTSQLNSIITSYSNNPAMLSSLHGTILSTFTHMAFGTPMNLPTPNNPSFQQAAGSTGQMHQQVGNSNSNAHVGTAIVDNVMRFLSQGPQGQQPPSTSYSQGQQVGQIPHASMQAPDLHCAQTNNALMLHHGTGQLNPRQNNPIDEFGSVQPIVDTTGTTTDTSTSSQGRNIYLHFGAYDTEPESNDRKRRRSPTPP